MQNEKTASQVGTLSLLSNIKKLDPLNKKAATAFLGVETGLKSSRLCGSATLEAQQKENMRAKLHTEKQFLNQLLHHYIHFAL